jgi:alkylation response protein AidB-like acyl-CoA dehydrogenase
VVALNALNMGRFKVGAVCVGNARGVFSEAVKYAQQRIQFNQPICEFGLIKEKIGDMATRLFAGESMMYRTAGMIDNNIRAGGDVPAAEIGRVTAGALEEYLIECSIMKIYGSETQGFVADQSVQIFGGYGYIYENPAELAYRNGRINRIWEGTNEINRATIAGTLLKRVAKERLALALEPAALLKDLSGLPPITEDRADDLESQKQMLAAAKSVACYMIATASQACDGNLSGHQEIAGILSDMVIEIYAVESALLRAAKLFSSGSRSKAVAVQMAKVLAVRLFDRMRSLACRALPSLVSGSDCAGLQTLIGRCLTPPPMDTIALVRLIADQCIKKKGVPLKII